LPDIAIFLLMALCHTIAIATFVHIIIHTLTHL